MKGMAMVFATLAAAVLLTGCQSPGFAYNAPPTGLDRSGPSIVILPLADSRSNREADNIFRTGYLTDVQAAIGEDLAGMKFFSAVTVAKDGENLPHADLQLTPTLQRLDWEIPHHGRVETAKVMAHTFNLISAVTVGLPVGDLYLITGTPVCGSSALDVAVRRTADQKLLLNAAYSDTVTNRFKKSVCDKAQTKATVMLAAFQNTQSEFKSDLLVKLLQDKITTAALKIAVPKK